MAWRQPFFFLIIPILEYLVGPSSAKQGREPELTVESGALHTLRDSPTFRAVVLVHVALSLVAYLFALAVIADPARAPSGFPENCIFIVSLSAVGVLNLVAGHELIHKVDRRSAFDRSLGSFVMSFMLNPAYGVDHHYHHLYVGTKQDGATAWKGQNIFAFICRMERISWSHAFSASLADTRNARKLPFVSGCNRFINGVALSFLMLLGVFFAFGAKSCLLYVLGCFLSTCFLDSANYAEHYGLTRKVAENGEMEPVSFKHSWDSTHPVTNLMVWQAGGHASHHMHGTLPYPELDLGRGPLYPYGMVTMCVASFVPRLFFSIADPIIEQYGLEGARHTS